MIYHNYVIRYHNGASWKLVPRTKRFWEARVYQTKEDAQEAIDSFNAPDWMKFRILRQGS